MYYIANFKTNKWARQDSQGEHDERVTDTLADAACFETYGEAGDYIQNFGNDWEIKEL